MGSLALGLMALGDSPGRITPGAGNRGGSANSALPPRLEGTSGSWSLLAVLPSPSLLGNSRGLALRPHPPTPGRPSSLRLLRMKLGLGEGLM